MQDEIISADQIFMQDMVCDEVTKNPKLDDFEIYNNLWKKIDIPDLETVMKILELIRINKMMLMDKDETLTF